MAPDAVATDQQRFAVASIEDLTLAAPDAEAASEAEAVARMERLIAARPELARRLQVVPSHEVNRKRVA